jgi:hypothetical protein
MQLEFCELRERMIENLSRPSNAFRPWGHQDPAVWDGVQRGLEACSVTYNLTALGNLYARSASDANAATSPEARMILAERAKTVGLVYQAILWVAEAREGHTVAHLDSVVGNLASAVLTDMVMERMKYAPAKSGKAYRKPAP